MEDEGGGELEGYKERDDEGRTTREGRRRRKTPPPKGMHELIRVTGENVKDQSLKVEVS